MQFSSGISWAEGKFLQKTLSYLLCQRIRFPWLSLATQLKDYLMYNNGLIDQSIQKWLPRDFLAMLSMWWGKTIDLKIIIIIIIKSIGKTHQVNKSEISEMKVPVCKWYDLWDNQNNKIHMILMLSWLWSLWDGWHKSLSEKLDSPYHTNVQKPLDVM